MVLRSQQLILTIPELENKLQEIFVNFEFPSNTTLRSFLHEGNAKSHISVTLEGI